MGSIAIISLTIGPLIGAFSIQDAIASFGSPIVWQIITVFFIARAIVKTNLSKRISFNIIKFFGKNVLGLGYGYVFSTFALGPMIPSGTARMGGIILPIIKASAQALGSDPEKGTEKKAGSFFILLALYSNAIVAAMFLTATAANPVIKNLAFSLGVNMTWLTWAKISLVPGFACLILMPLILYFLYPPQLKHLPKINHLLDLELEKLGKISLKEKQTMFILTFVLCGWIIGDYINLDAILTSLIGICGLILLKVLNFEHDLLTEKEAWNTMIWLSVILFLSKTLHKSGFLSLIINNLNFMLIDLNWQLGLVILIILYGYSHYFFASNTAHVSALFALFLGIAVKIGAPAQLSAFIFAFTTSLFSGLSHFSSTEAVLSYNTKYVQAKEFFKYGFIMSTLMLLIWMLIGLIWWKALYLY
jgi:anion transporter